MNISFEKIITENTYTRIELAKLWRYKGYEAISKGIVTPSNSKYIILFITKEKQTHDKQYENILEYGVANIDDEKSHTNDNKIVHAEKNKKQIHLFYRKKRRERFLYMGIVTLENYEINVKIPSKFIFRLKQESLKILNTRQIKDSQKSNSIIELYNATEAANTQDVVKYFENAEQNRATELKEQLPSGVSETWEPLVGQGDSGKPHGQLPDEIVNQYGIHFRLISSGKFFQGASADDVLANENEMPRHQVEIASPFYLGSHLVTQEQWKAVMDKECPSFFKGDIYPVDSVSWFDAVEFYEKLSEKSGEKYRLPTEAEWEYAARSISTARYSWGDGVDREYCWYIDNSRGSVRPVGEKNPNNWGLYDTSGNVWEWCSDWYEHDYYKSRVNTDPHGPSSGYTRVLRGGCWLSQAASLRVSFRYAFNPESRLIVVGFRLVKEIG